jgi:hypothetical protein
VRKHQIRSAIVIEIGGQQAAAHRRRVEVAALRDRPANQPAAAFVAQHERQLHPRRIDRMLIDMPVGYRQVLITVEVEVDRSDAPTDHQPPNCPESALST